jgi:lysophospholipase L1-like esterase
MSPTFKLNGTAQVYMHGIGGRKVRKVRNHYLGVVARLSPDIVILEIGTNDLSLLPPEVVGSEIEDLVSLLQQTYHVKVVCVCLVTLCNRNPVFNAKQVIVNKYLTVVLEHVPNVFTWLHQVLHGHL